MPRDRGDQVAYVSQCLNFLIRESKSELALKGYQNANMLQTVPSFDVLRSCCFGYLTNVLVVDDIDDYRFYVFKKFSIRHLSPYKAVDFIGWNMMAHNGPIRKIAITK